MSVATFKNVAQKLPSTQSVLLRAVHGVGKSKIVRQVAHHLKNGDQALGEFKVIDKRLSQLSDGDMIGLPSTDGNVTRFNPPDWYMQACKVPCCLFLDELNRATNEVMQAAFQVVLDRELNGHKLHPLTRVYAAINTGAQYIVNEMDLALLDRFWVIDLKPTLEDWLEWAKEKSPEVGGNIHPVVIEFIQGNEKWLFPPKNVEPNTKSVSPRTWEKLSVALTGVELIDSPEDPLFWSMCLGFVGVEATNAFVSFAKSIDTRFTGEDILKDYAKVKPKIARLGQERLNVALEKLCDYVLANCETLNAKQSKNLHAFTKDLPAELRIVFWRKLTANGIKKVKLAQSVNKAISELILEVFGVPKGPAGEGVVPNLPSFETAAATNSEQ